MKCSLVRRTDMGKSCCKWRREPMGIRSSSHTSTNRLRRSPTAKRSLASDLGAQVQLTVRGESRRIAQRPSRLCRVALGTHEHLAYERCSAPNPILLGADDGFD